MIPRTKLVQLVRELVHHLDYVGWGDSWERECSEELRAEAERALAELKCETVPDGAHCAGDYDGYYRLVPCNTHPTFARPQPHACTRIATWPIAVWNRKPFSLVRCAWRKPGARVRRSVRGLRPCE